MQVEQRTGTGILYKIWNQRANMMPFLHFHQNIHTPIDTRGRIRCWYRVCISSFHGNYLKNRYFYIDEIYWRGLISYWCIYELWKCYVIRNYHIGHYRNTVTWPHIMGPKIYSLRVILQIITYLDFFINRLYRKSPGWYTVISARIHISPGTTLVKMLQHKWCLSAPTWRNS